MYVNNLSNNIFHINNHYVLLLLLYTAILLYHLH